MILKICSARTYRSYTALCTINFLTRRRFFHKTHYDALSLPRDCSQKEIRDAYIKLSKELHPDRNNSKSSHANFVNIVAAYNVLSKPDLRRNYDLDLRISAAMQENTRVVQTEDVVQNEGGVAGTAADPIFWKNRDRSRDKYYESQSYYGIKGMKKVSNVIVVVACLAFAAVGVSLQVLAIRKSLTFKRAQMIRMSTEAEKNLLRSRIEAEKNGNTEQIERLKERFLQNQVCNIDYQKKGD